MSNQIMLAPYLGCALVTMFSTKFHWLNLAKFWEFNILRSLLNFDKRAEAHDDRDKLLSPSKSSD